MKRLVLAAALLAMPGVLAAEEAEKCNFTSNSGTLATSYDQIGTEACTQFCAGTDGCTAWLYTPHNFNPTGAPGECRAYAEVGDKREPDSTASTQYCGTM